MASRYGRKQKRAHRQMIADLACTERFLRGQLGERERQVFRQKADILCMRERLQDWDRRIRSMLGPYTSAAINDTTFRVDRKSVRQMEIVPPIRIDFVRMSDPMAMPEEITYYVEEILYLVEGLTDEDRIGLSRHLCFWVEHDGAHHRREAAYGMSRTHFEHLMRSGEDGIKQLAHHIAPRIAQLLLADRNKQQQKARA